MKHSVLIAATLASLLLVPGRPHAAEALKPLPGFGNIPFGASADNALQLNNGNGVFTRNGDRSATLAYPTLIAGLNFQVTQNFDTNGRATNAILSYTSHEAPNACIPRFNYMLHLLEDRYGKASSAPPATHEETGGMTTDRYPIEFAFADKAAIKAQVTVIFPTPTPASTSSQGTSGQAAAPAIPPDCRITLEYLPQGWAASF
jgi:hypothetical protein